MIIRSSRFEGELITEDYQFATLEIEEPNCLRGILKTLNGNVAEYADLIVLVDKKRIDFETDSLTIYNPLAFDINDKKLLAALYKKIEKELSGNAEYNSELQTRIYETARQLENLINNNCYELSIEKTVALKDVMKLFSVRLEDNISVVAGLTNFLQANAEFKLYKLIVFVNARNYLTVAEMQELLKGVSAAGTSVIFLENRRSDERYRNERKIIIDADGHEVIE